MIEQKVLCFCLKCGKEKENLKMREKGKEGDEKLKK